MGRRKKMTDRERSDKLNLPQDVDPGWNSGTGVPRCTPGRCRGATYEGGCRHREGRKMSACEPAVEAMARAIPGFLPPQPIARPARVLSPDARALEAELRASMSAKEGKGA